MPEEFTTLQSGAYAVHEVYLSYINAGFTPEQAMQLVITHLQMRPPPRAED